jgi:hypothetical protein
VGKILHQKKVIDLTQDSVAESFLDAFEKLRKVTIGFFVFVRLFVCMEQLSSH